tara:strand:+ start:300 stop:2561 length:2262 start_codon:yes stop_codon:yes gene_type:complete
MEKNELIKELLSELSYRSNEGYPILENREHISILAEILDDWGYGSIKNELIENLLEAEPKSKTDDLYKSIGGTGYVLAKDFDKWEKNKDAYTGDKFTKGKDGQYTKQGGDDTEQTKTGQEIGGPGDFAHDPSVNGNTRDKPKEFIKKPTDGESSTAKTKRRSKNNLNTDEKISNSNGDINITSELTTNRRKQLNDLIDAPQGGGGSLLGEKSGGDAAAALSKNPNLTSDEFVKQQLEELRGSALYDKMIEESGSSKKYAKDPERYVREWLEVGYRTGKGELDALNKEKKYKFKNPQSNPYPIPVVMDYNQQQIVKSTFEAKLKDAETKCGSGTDEACNEVVHLKRQLEWINKLEDTDSGIIYETEDGYLGFKHTSNKKGWGAPHNNTSIDVKGEKIKEIVPTIAKINKLSDKQSEELSENLNKTISDASSIVKGAETVIADDCKKIENVDDFVSKNTIIAKHCNFGNARSGDKQYLRKASSAGIVKEKLEQKGIDPKMATDDEIFQACIELKQEGKTNGDVDSVILKTSETIKRIRAYKAQGLTLKQIRQKIQNLGDISDEELQQLVDACENKSADILLDTNDKRKESMKVAHTKVVEDIRNHDQNLALETREEYYPNPETAKNGPHQQAYTDSFLKDIHYTRYIDGDVEGIQSINIDGYDIQPKHFRGCLKDLSGFDGDTETPEGKEQLKQHLRENLRIKPGDSSVTFNGARNGEDVELGREDYRTKGKSKSILAHLGTDIIKCLKGKVGAQ